MAMKDDGILSDFDGDMLNMGLGHPAKGNKIGHRLRLIGLGGGNAPNAVEYLSQDRVIQQSLNGILQIDTNQWTKTNVDGGADSGEVFASGDTAGGLITITTNDADNDCEQQTWKNEIFKLASNKPCFFDIWLATADATQCDFTVGLIKTEDLTAVADNMPADGAVFKKDDGDTNIDFASSKNGTNEVLSAVGTASTSLQRLSFFFDGNSKIHVYVAGAKKGVVSTTICDDEELALTLQVRAGEAAAKTMTIRSVDIAQVL